MPTYSYTAKTLSGQKMTGKMNANDETQLMTILREKQLFLMKADEIERREKYKKLKAMELAEFCREIGTMLKAGVPLVRALNIILNRKNPAHIQRMYTRLYQSLQKGLLFSEAMKEQADVFPELLIQMIRAGESGGNLDQAALKMAEHYEKEHRLNSKVSGAMTYPIVLLFITVAVVLLIFLIVLPNFFSMFQDMKLPLITRIMVGISRGLLHYWYIVLGVVILLIVLIGFLMKKDSFRYGLDRFKLHAPKAGKMLRVIYTARFSRTLSSLYESGLPIVSALQISKRTIGNRYIEAQFDEVIRQVQNGTPLSESIRPVDGFDGKLSSTILIGEETSRLGAMLASISDSFDYEAEMASQKLVTLLEPMMIVTMALIVGFIMISVLLPILQLYKNIGH